MIESECINSHQGNCKGRVELRMSLSGTGQPIPRCDHHWDERLQLEDDLNQRYPVTAPSEWSPLDAGEAWDEDDY